MYQFQSKSISIFLGFVFSCLLSFFGTISQNSSAYALEDIPSKSTLDSAIAYVTNFADYQTYISSPSSSLPHRKEYAHLHSIVTEMNTLSANYQAVASISY